jgi:tRNA uridine 5-carboxymethylaminomethyl modification enzyme
LSFWIPHSHQYTIRPLLNRIHTMQRDKTFDVIVIGGGHAGTEAALASARAGANTLLVTHKFSTLGQMSCNPAIGGIGKGHLTKEVDALGGAMARAIDAAGIQFRTLNASKGPAVRATRAQADRELYRAAIQKILSIQKNLSLHEDSVEDLLIVGNKITGIQTKNNDSFYARCVVLTTGTFLGGKILRGQYSEQGGRVGDAPANKLAAHIRSLPFTVNRLKTGTPPRLHKMSLNYELMASQPGDIPRPVFSYLGRRDDHPKQLMCHITKTTEKTHEIIRKEIHQSPMFSGLIKGVGPRYCPSIEDKVVRFADKTSHQIFVEPEGHHSDEIYPNGISTSLPESVQMDFVRSIIGFENAIITQPGYAIEYDFLDPRDLKLTLETKQIKGLFFAGQINGTTGYEEAAAQGLIAGLNAQRKAHEQDPWHPLRQNSYMGVMIDDLTTRGVTEPYRMFTSRAEHRLLLREDNADKRLTSIGRKLNLVDDVRWKAFNQKIDVAEKEQLRLQSIFIRKKDLTKSDIKILGSDYKKEATAADLLRRPLFSHEMVTSLSAVGATPWVKNNLHQELIEQIQVQLETKAKYAGYIDRQEREIIKHSKQEMLVLPLDINYVSINGLSNEARQRLEATRPETLGQASRMEGITPAAISLLLIHLKKRYLDKTA